MDDDSTTFPKKKRYSYYILGQLQKAVESIKSKEMSCEEAAEFYDVPISALYENIWGYEMETNGTYIIFYTLMFDWINIFPQK